MRNKEYQRLMKSGTWQRIRLSYLKDNPLCERCEARGLTVPAAEIHHIIPIANEKDYARMRRLAYDRNNLQALCTACHHEVHEIMRTKGTAGIRGRAEVKRNADAFVKSFAERFLGAVTDPGE